MFNALFRNVHESEKSSAIADIIDHATPRQDFFLMLVLSVAMAAFGLLLGSTVIVVGSMLIAPLLYPLLSMALGIIVGDEKLIARSLYTVAKSLLFALAAAFLIGFLFLPHTAPAAPLAISGASPLLYAVVAVIAGFAGAFAMTKPYLNETLPGVAISVALVPPLASAGLALAIFNWKLFSDSLLLFLVNVIGIVFSAMVVFALMGFAVKKTAEQQAIKKEDKIIAQEAQSAPAPAQRTNHV